MKIYSDLGKEHQDFYKAILVALLSSLKILEDDDPKKPDFIIANYDYKDPSIPVLFIRDYPLYEDAILIYEAMRKVIKS